ncbi:hypothetical protein C8R44DRAFT_870419 [Mycena epipterygia]|nr:hypothetical protein C8R44DRAFT_870419 [Mycena epipterygia]
MDLYNSDFLIEGALTTSLYEPGADARSYPHWTFPTKSRSPEWSKLKLMDPLIPDFTQSRLTLKDYIEIAAFAEGLFTVPKDVAAHPHLCADPTNFPALTLEEFSCTLDEVQIPVPKECHPRWRRRQLRRNRNFLLDAGRLPHPHSLGTPLPKGLVKAAGAVTSAFAYTYGEGLLHAEKGFADVRFSEPPIVIQSACIDHPSNGWMLAIDFQNAKDRGSKFTTNPVNGLNLWLDHATDRERSVLHCGYLAAHPNASHPALSADDPRQLSLSNPTAKSTL